MELRAYAPFVGRGTSPPPRVSRTCLRARCERIRRSSPTGRRAFFAYVWKGARFVAAELPDRLLRIDEVADALALSTRSTRRLIHDGILEGVRLRGSVRVRRSDVACLIAGGRNVEG